MVVLLDAERARLFVSQLGFIDEVADLIGEAPAETHKGMYAEMRFQRQRDSHVLWHAGAVAHATALAMEQFGAKWLLVSGSSEVLADYRNSLPMPISQRLAATFSLPILASLSDVAVAVRPLQADVEAREELSTVERLEAEPAGGKASWGLSETLRAVSDGRVHTLVLVDDYHAPGGDCGDCGLVSADTAGNCSNCGKEIVAVDDVVDLALERAFQLSAGLELVRSEEARQRMLARAPIAALLRY
jgi:peptide subunit release factor 1 (eRF1)